MDDEQIMVDILADSILLTVLILSAICGIILPYVIRGILRIFEKTAGFSSKKWKNESF